MAKLTALTITVILACAYLLTEANKLKHVDCKKYIYHPKCRGVGSKRSKDAPISVDYYGERNGENDSSRDESNERDVNSRDPLQDKYLRSLFRQFWLRRLNDLDV